MRPRYRGFRAYIARADGLKSHGPLVVICVVEFVHGDLDIQRPRGLESRWFPVDDSPEQHGALMILHDDVEAGSTDGTTQHCGGDAGGA